ncbi:putative lipid II flippase FtsW [Patescibacteria group bacterium]|nr:putative lipid II flippase FtsW [Patescibacteria group bacterium]
MALKKKIDRPFVFIVIVLVVVGFFIFTSASLGLLARDGPKFSTVAFNQLFLGIILGTVALLITSHINYRFWRKYSFFIFLFSIVTTLLVFVPGFGIEFSGAKRWLSLGFLPSFQPAELLKLSFVIYFAAWLSGIRNHIHEWRYGIAPLLILLGVIGAILLAQPDTGTFLVIFVTAIAMFVVAGARLRDLAILGAVSAGSIALLALIRPYVMERLLTFINPASDPLGTSYQIQQSLIAIGSGQIFGRGFGQSIQKFNFLPEAMGDSIFAVAAEEFGFVGSLILIALFLTLAFRGLSIASKAPDYFGGLLVVGIVMLIVSQSFINIASMLGVFPLTGLPLLFISQGGSALLFTLAGIGIILNISKYSKR